MRYITVLILALALPLSAQYVAPVSVSIDTATVKGLAAFNLAAEARAEVVAAEAAVSVAWVDSVVVADSLDFSTLGVVTVSASNVDGQWVHIDLPLSTTTGLAKVLIRQALIEAREDYKARRSGIGQIYIRKGSAIKFLRGLDAALNQ